jgi:hypothetical protein
MISASTVDMDGRQKGGHDGLRQSQSNEGIIRAGPCPRRIDNGISIPAAARASALIANKLSVASRHSLMFW